MEIEKDQKIVYFSLYLFNHITLTRCRNEQPNKIQKKKIIFDFSCSLSSSYFNFANYTNEEIASIQQKKALDKCFFKINFQTIDELEILVIVFISLVRLLVSFVQEFATSFHLFLHIFSLRSSSSSLYFTKCWLMTMILMKSYTMWRFTRKNRAKECEICSTTSSHSVNHSFFEFSISFQQNLLITINFAIRVNEPKN